MSIYFAVGYDGHLYNLCDCGDIEAAEESAADVIPDMEGQVTASKAMWLFDAETAAEWLNVLMKGLTMNNKCKVTAGPGIEDDRICITLNELFDVELTRTDEGIVTDIYGRTDVGGPIATTYAFDQESLPEEEEE